MEHDQTAAQTAEKVVQPNQDLSEVGMQITDIIVTSGLIEQYGPELGLSGAVIVALIGLYWKYRKGGKFTQEDLETVMNAIADKPEEKKPEAPKETEDKSSPEEVEELKNLNEEAENKAAQEAK